jgi:drug/metabolite transporter (DMT)-like permease
MVPLATALLLTRGSVWPTWATVPQLGILSLSGIIGFVFGDASFFRALVILGPGRAALLASTTPIFTTLLAWPVLGEVPGHLALLGMTLTLCGVAWVLYQREHQNQASIEGSLATGIIAGILGAFGQAGGYVLSKMALRTGIGPLSATVVRIAAAAVVLWVMAALQGETKMTLGALRDRTGALLTAGGAFCGPFLGVTLSLAAVQHVEAGVAASIIAFNPVLTLLISSRFHGERVTLRTMAGALVAVAGVIVLFLR